MIETFKKLLNDADKVLVTSHKSPDGDAVGSSVACYEFLKSIGKDPYLCTFPEMEDIFLFVTQIRNQLLGVARLHS